MSIRYSLIVTDDRVIMSYVAIWEISLSGSYYARIRTLSQFFYLAK